VGNLISILKKLLKFQMKYSQLKYVSHKPSYKFSGNKFCKLEQYGKGIVQNLRVCDGCC